MPEQTENRKLLLVNVQSDNEGYVSLTVIFNENEERSMKAAEEYAKINSPGPHAVVLTDDFLIHKAFVNIIERVNEVITTDINTTMN